MCMEDVKSCKHSHGLWHQGRVLENTVEFIQYVVLLKACGTGLITEKLCRLFWRSEVPKN